MQRQRGAGLGAVDQRQALFGSELQRRDAGGGQHGGGGPFFTIHQKLTLAHQRQRHVRQWCQVARRADRALAGHARAQAGVVHGDQGVDHHWPHA